MEDILKPEWRVKSLKEFGDKVNELVWKRKKKGEIKGANKKLSKMLRKDDNTNGRSGLINKATSKLSGQVVTGRELEKELMENYASIVDGKFIGVRD